jgi:hypothetical protein
MSFVESPNLFSLEFIRIADITIEELMNVVTSLFPYMGKVELLTYKNNQTFSMP